MISINIKDIDEAIEKFKGFKEDNKTDDDFSADYDEWVSTMISWLEELKDGCAKCKKMFNIDISVDWRFKDEQTNDVDNTVNL